MWVWGQNRLITKGGHFDTLVPKRLGVDLLGRVVGGGGVAIAVLDLGRFRTQVDATIGRNDCRKRE